MTADRDRERIAAHVRKLVAAAPPLSDAQRQRLQRLLAPAPVPRR